MLQPPYRLRHDATLRRLRRKGKRWQHPLATLLILKQDRSQPALVVSRFAFSASRRVGNAVVRNRARRRLRESVRCVLPELPAGYDCLLIARRATADAAQRDVDLAVRQLLQRSGLLPLKAPL